MKAVVFIGFIALATTLSAGDGKLDAFFSAHCVKCHGAEKQKGDVRLDHPGHDWFADRDLVESLIMVLEDGEMPPKKETQPDPETVAAVLQDLESKLAQERPQSTLKRLTRNEYTNVINDLFEADFDLTELLPEDHVEHGFDKFGKVHLMSPHQVRSYLTTARYVADRLLPDSKPEERHWDFGPEQFFGSGRGDYKVEDALYLSTNYPWRSNLHFSLVPNRYGKEDRFIIPEFGRYRFEIEVEAVNTEEDQTVGINLGDPRYPTNFRKIRRVFLPRDTKGFTVDLTLNEGDEVSFTFDSAKIWRVNRKPRDYEGPKLRFTRVKVNGPSFDRWPTFAQERLLPERKMNPEDLVDHLSGILTNRPLKPDDRSGFVEFAAEKVAAGASPTEVTRSLLTALLASPHFIYKGESTELSDIELAYRLSFFLWNSAPDDALIAAARSGEFRQNLPELTEQMLADPKSERFITDFTRQWLQLDKVDDISPDERVFDDVTPLHVVAMAGEGTALFRHILKNDRSLVEFIDSDYQMVNDQLADFYGLPAVKGEEFRPVSLPAGSERGGLIGQAGFLKLTSNTFASSPILRGVWILNNLYDEKMEPPADLVIEEPDIRGTTTIKEVVARHQQSESCYRCHSKIDPLGFALEFYDPVGRRRSEYRNIEVVSKEKVKIEKHPIDAEMKMTDGRIVHDMTSLKSAMMEDRELIIKGILGKLFSYGLGRETTVLDRDTIDEIYRQIEPHNYSLRAGIKAIVSHP
ncbi:MAG: DUF1592 domain-containing protein, partial [Verrucomicrobiales bacterium]|nr:DUF1592 domain-containing protein [Verrucomicrobiales bacterium]